MIRMTSVPAMEGWTKTTNVNSHTMPNTTLSHKLYMRISASTISVYVFVSVCKEGCYSCDDGTSCTECNGSYRPVPGNSTAPYDCDSKPPYVFQPRCNETPFYTVTRSFLAVCLSYVTWLIQRLRFGSACRANTKMLQPFILAFKFINLTQTSVN